LTYAHVNDMLLTPPDEWLASPPTFPDDAILIFYSDVDASGQMWCPDCRKVKSTVDWLFNGRDKPPAYIIWVGSKAEWKLPAKNHYRIDYRINSIPTMVKFKDGKETQRLVEDEILDTDALARFFLQ